MLLIDLQTQNQHIHHVIYTTLLLQIPTNCMQDQGTLIEQSVKYSNRTALYIPVNYTIKNPISEQCENLQQLN